MTFLVDILPVSSVCSVQTALLVCVVTFLIWLWRRMIMTWNLPPGPRGWPLLGCLPKLAYRSYKTGKVAPELFMELADEYGEVFSMYMGNKLAIVLNGYESIKEAYNNPDLSDRPQSGLLEETGISKGVGSVNGEPWKNLRKFSFKTLRAFGVGTRGFESQVVQESNILLDHLKAYDGKPFDPKTPLAHATSNLMCRVLFDKHYDYSGQEMKKVLEIIDGQVEAVGIGGMLIFPFLRYLNRKAVAKYIELSGNQFQYLGDIIAEHKKSHISEKPRDFIDVFLSEMKINGGSSKVPGFDDMSLTSSLYGLMIAGGETTNTTLSWSLLYMMFHPKIQARIQEEIDTAVGRDRLPSLADKTNLPYTEATILEIQRICNVSPMGLAHMASKDTTLGKFSIPKGTMMMSNLWAVHKNPKYWPHPEEFRPERFLDSNGSLHQPEHFIPFSTGRRVCIGENLAKMELFIFFTHLLHQFTFKKPKDSPPLSLKGITTLTNAPQSFLVEAIPR